jgi:hypothetical protein
MSSQARDQATEHIINRTTEQTQSVNQLRANTEIEEKGRKGREQIIRRENRDSMRK